MTWPATLLTVVVVGAGAACGGYFFALHQHANIAANEASTEPATTEADADPAPVPVVTTTPLAIGPIADRVVAYGNVQTRSGAVLSASVPYETRVLKVLVGPNQPVGAGADLVEVEPSPDVAVSVRDAQNALDAAVVALKQTQQRYDKHLATNVDLSQAQQAEQTARFRVQTFTDRGVDKPHMLKADGAGVVGKVNAQAGQIVAAGSPLVEIAAGDRGEVRLNVDPSDALALKPGQTVHLHTAGKDEAVDGTIRSIARRLDPTTRLVEVLVDPPAGAELLLESFVTAEFDRATAEGLIVPRDAALPNEEGHYELFTVADGKAVKHDVRLGLQTSEQVQVIADDLKAGDAVVIEGNAELEDGMAVRVEAPATEPIKKPAAATTEAAS